MPGACFHPALLTATGLPDRLHSAFSDPNLAFLAVLAGLLGIYCEFLRPGLVIPGVAGGLLAILGISSLAVLPLSSLGVTLLLLAGGLFLTGAAADKSFPWITAGAAVLAAGAIRLQETGPGIHPFTATAATIPFAAITAYLIQIAARARRNKRVRT